MLKPDQVADLRAAFDFLVRMRLRGQVEGPAHRPQTGTTTSRSAS